MTEQRQLAAVLRDDSGINERYQHGPKRVAPGDSLEMNGAVLKWYELYSEEQRVPDAINRLARSYLRRAPLEAKGLGFVILHRCGHHFYFLIVSSWRGNNELWETVFYKDGDAMSDFALWPRDGIHKPTYCVWELAPVWHEKQAWERFLLSARDEAAAQLWQHDLCADVA
jgi:hypothetical protein